MDIPRLPIPPRPTAATDMRDAATFAVACILAGAFVFFIGRAFASEEVVNFVALAFASLGFAFVARAWWIGPICAHLDRVAVMLEVLYEHRAQVERIGKAVAEGSVGPDAVRSPASAAHDMPEPRA